MMVTEKQTTLQSDSNFIGTPCHVCEEHFAAGDTVIFCPRCHQIHHAACWQQYGGCARRGCAQLAATHSADKPRITDDDRAKQYRRPLPPWVPWTFVLLGIVLIIGVPLLRNTVFADKRPKLTVFIPRWENESYVETMVQAFEEERPDLQIQLIITPQGGAQSLYDQKLAVMIGAGDPPDLFALDWSRFVAFAEQGAFAPLDEWVASQPAAIEDIPEERLERGFIDDHWYGIPHSSRSSFFGIFHASPMYDEALELLERIVEAIPVDESVRDRYRIDMSLPYIPRLW